ncbi:MAG: carboxylating nicotinate-nucleotide diphosphorylase [Actinomycetota bacterium]
MTTPADPTEALAERALDEDAPGGDLTTERTIPVEARCTAELRAKADGVLAGVDATVTVFDLAAAQDGTELSIDRKLTDGSPVRPGEVVLVVRGSARTVLRAERTAINLLAHLSGVATLTRRFVDAAAPATVLCTRKTLPGLRHLERSAVAAGGGFLHRASLTDAILIKDNHLRVAGGITRAVAAARAGDAQAPPIEVEVETLEQLDEALATGAERILLDNPGPDLVREAVARVGDPQRLEVSGGVTLESVGALVEAGARIVSVGALTHSAPSLDLSMEVTSVDG